jgi:hypothetical protein
MFTMIESDGPGVIARAGIVIIGRRPLRREAGFEV